jgi:phosphohistidine swiveling domain-containing protein
MLDEVDAASVDIVGGKGANLGELVAAGVSVPAAFCVSTHAYQTFLAAGTLDDDIGELLCGIDFSDPAGIETTASLIRTRMLDTAMPSNVVADIAAAYETLESELGSDVSVSVRSSATAEDLPGFSFAGQQDTYLHIAGGAQVIDAVRRCWASLWTDRAIAYRHAQGFDQRSVAIAVIVQEMFRSEVSGVLFTANPVTSNPNECFVNLSWGLGEAVVSGRVNPDQLVVSKDDLQVIDRQTNDKAVMTVADPSGQGSMEVPVPDDRRFVPCLADEAVRELCQIGQHIEAHYGFYQDIEWGYADGRFAILQAREITGADLDFGHELETWKTTKALADMYDDRWLWSRAYSDEVQTGPSTPSFYTYLQLGMTALKVTALRFTDTPTLLGYEAGAFADFPYFRWYGARAYYNTAFERERIRMFIPPFARDDAALWPFPVDEREEIRNLPFDWDEFFGLLRRLEDNRPGISLLGTTEVVYEGLERWTDQEDEFWEGVDLDTLTVAEIFAAQLASRSESKFGENVILPFTIYLFMLPAALQTLCQVWFDDDGGIYNRLVGGLQTKTAEENAALWDLTAVVKASPPLVAMFASSSDDDLLTVLAASEDGRDFLVDLRTFTDRYGHRGGAERDAYHPRWRDDPALVFRSLRLMLALEDEHAPATHEARQHKLMVETKAACEERLRGEGDGSDAITAPEWLLGFNALAEAPATTRADQFAWFVELVQDYFYYRDFERFYNDKTMSRSRYLYEAIARRFVASGLLTREDDVFFLGRQEMLAADVGDVSPTQIAIRIRSRRRVYEKYRHQEPPKYIRGWEVFDDQAVDADGALVGIGASSGVVTGRARVCRELSEISRIEPGDILVTVATDPGWTTVFSIIGAVVVETGGVVAHAVMISREYGLPCVANLSRACDLIPDGATITVDGNTGLVAVVEA